jgi:hypothetical protein
MKMPKFLAFNHNDRLLAHGDDELELFRQCNEYALMTGNSFYLADEADYVPECPRCRGVLSQDHNVKPDYYACCVDCNEDFYIDEINQFVEREDA